MDETDLLEPIAGPSTTSHDAPIDLLTADLDELDNDTIASTLQTLGDEEAVDVCIRLVTTRSTDNAATARRIIDIGVARSAHVAEKTKAKIEEEIGHAEWKAISTKQLNFAMGTILGENQASRSMLNSHSHLVNSRQRLDTFEAFAPSAEAGPSRPRAVAKAQTEEVEVDDPWADNEETETELEDPWETGSTKSAHSVRSTESVARSVHDTEEQEQPPIPLSTFLADPLPDSACTMASGGDLKALGVVYGRHRNELWPYRFAILDAIPPWVSPADIGDIGLLPTFGPEGREIRATNQPTSFAEHLATVQPTTDTTDLPALDVQSLSEVHDWLVARVDSLDSLGLLDVQLAWVQHGASLGVPDLDAIGEELSLLSRLVYDANLSPKQQAEWTLSSWRRASPDSVIKAYISNSIQSGIVSDVRRLVLPYLYVLESKAERAGEPHTELVEDYLHDIILSLPLNLALPLFEASKATLSASERIIKNDLTVARLALACLYGSNERNKWTIMSSIFECLPVWDVSGGDPESDKEATSTTLDSIAAFIRPTRAGAHPPTPKDLFIFFAPLPFASLSRALDILDVHLESGEILARWDTPVQLRFLLQSAKNKEDQLELAEKMVRRQLGGKHTETRWIGLWGDMKKLSGGEDALMRGAFGVLEREDMLRIYLGGLISSGKFDISRKIIDRLQTEEGIPGGMLEKAVLQASREFYENAESGNIHTGEMKLAYDSLSVAPSTDDIVKEREFIEATSRISTFAIKSPSGRGTLSPLEIRHAKNRLDLVRQILETSDDAYRHPELILDLTSKLGYHKDASAKIKVLAMLTGAATKAGEYDTAFTHSQQMFSLASKRHVETDVVWKALLDLGSQTDYAEIPNRMTVLGQAVELCPAEELPTILATWHKVEDGQMRLSEAAKRRRIAGIRSTSTHKRPSAPSSVTSNAAEERVLGSRTAARAARLAMGFAGNHLNLRGIAPSPLIGSPATSIAGGATPRLGHDEEVARRSNESDRPNFGAMFEGAGVKAGTAEAERVRQQARKALVRGVGWLLGADDREISEGH